MRRFVINPVLDKEYRLRMRSMRSMWILLTYLFAMGLFATAVFFVNGVTSGSNHSSGVVNEILFIVMSYYQLALISFMAPALTAGVISGEREKQTLNLLLTTQQTSSSIIFSKLLSSLSFMTLIVFSTLPIYGIIFLFGGIAPSQFLAIFGFFIFTMIVFGGIGILFSTLLKRTILAIIVTYGVILFMYAGSAIIFLILQTMFSEYIYSSTYSGNYNWITHILAFNPAAALLSVFEPSMFQDLINSGVNKGFHHYIPLWLEYMIIYTVIFLICMRIAIRKLRPIAKKHK